MSAAALAAVWNRRWAADAAMLALAGLTLAACAGGPRPGVGAGGIEGQATSRYTGYKVGKPYQVRGIWYYPQEQPHYDEIGVASWYGAQFHNQYTADGEVFDMNMPSAAHKTLPLPSLVEVTNLANGKTLLVRVNDRGPFIDGRVIDLSKAGAEALGFVAGGLTRVRVRYVGHAPDPPGWVTPQAPPSEPRQQVASLSRRIAPAATLPPAPVPYTDLNRSAASPPAAQPVTPPPPAAPGPALPDVDRLLADLPTAPPQAATYALQAGTFPTEAAAQSFAANLTGSGLPEVQPTAINGQILYRVVIHGLANPTEADAARREAIALGAQNPTIVRGS